MEVFTQSFVVNSSLIFIAVQAFLQFFKVRHFCYSHFDASDSLEWSSDCCEMEQFDLWPGKRVHVYFDFN